MDTGHIHTTTTTTPFPCHVHETLCVTLRFKESNDYHVTSLVSNSLETSRLFSIYTHMFILCHPKFTTEGQSFTFNFLYLVTYHKRVSHKTKEE